MQIIRTIQEAHQWSDEHRATSRIIGFVPTMGYLHEGHMTLIDVARRESDVVAASIFVNPTQFGPQEDLARYPRDFDRDCELLRSRGCEMLFAPSVEEMYPQGFSTSVKVRGISSLFEGHYRPTHFDGVAVVVTKLLLSVKAHRLYLGQKDFQQTMVVRRMITDLNIDIQLVIVPTVRESDGLAMSSRNVFLSEQDRANALGLSKALHNVQRAISQGVRRAATLDEIALKSLREHPGVAVDYAHCVLTQSLGAKEDYESGDEIVCLIAARVGTTRLIDNAVFLIP